LAAIQQDITRYSCYCFFGALQTAAEWQTGNVMMQAVW